MSQALALHERLELFADDFVIERLSGDARKVLQKPQPKEVVFTTDAAWEGNLSASYSIFQDGEGYRMYYRGAAAGLTMRELSHPMADCTISQTLRVTPAEPAPGGSRSEARWRALQ